MPHFEDWKTGVYCILNKVNGKRYIGSAAVSIESRWYGHRWGLCRGNHKNKHLQAAWNKYGELSFEFFILVKCSPESCLTMEQIYLDKYRSYEPQYGYNTCRIAGSSLGVQRSDETKKKISTTVTEYLNRPEVKAANSLRILEAWKRPEVRANHRKAMNRPETKAKHKAAVTSQRYRKNHSAVMKQVMNAVETKAKTSKSAKEAWARPGAKKRRSAISKSFWQRPEVKERQSKSQLRAWKRPGARSKRIAKLKNIDNRGANNGMAKLTTANVKYMLKAYKAIKGGKKKPRNLVIKLASKLAKKFNVSKKQVLKILARKAWKHL